MTIRKLRHRAGYVICRGHGGRAVRRNVLGNDANIVAGFAVGRTKLHESIIVGALVSTDCYKIKLVGGEVFTVTKAIKAGYIRTGIIIRRIVIVMPIHQELSVLKVPRQINFVIDTVALCIGRCVGMAGIYVIIGIRIVEITVIPCVICSKENA